MKKLLITILVLSAICSGCYTSKGIYCQVGMTERDFLSYNKDNTISIAEATMSRTVYEICNEYGYNCSFFYFRNGYMYQMDRGDAQPDILITNQ